MWTKHGYFWICYQLYELFSSSGHLFFSMPLILVSSKPRNLLQPPQTASTHWQRYRTDPSQHIKNLISLFSLLQHGSKCLIDTNTLFVFSEKFTYWTWSVIATRESNNAYFFQCWLLFLFTFSLFRPFSFWHSFVLKLCRVMNINWVL